LRVFLRFARLFINIVERRYEWPGVLLYLAGSRSYEKAIHNRSLPPYLVKLVFRQYQARTSGILFT